MDAFEILVVILSIALAILLTVSIFFVVVLVKLVNQIRAISKKAEEIMDDVEVVSGFFRRSAPKVAITSLISNIVAKVTEMKGKKEK